MNVSQDTLAKLQSISAIVAAIAIPVVLAVVGYFIQDKIASEGLKRDYVQIAIGVLKEKKDKDNDDVALRRWAIEVLDRNAPVRFSPDLKEILQKGIKVIKIDLGPEGNKQLTKDLIDRLKRAEAEAEAKLRATDPKDSK